MSDPKKTSVVAGVVVLGVLGLLVWNYTDAIREKNEVDRERIESTERLKQLELEQERERIESTERLKQLELNQERAQTEEEQRLEQAKLNRELEADCQKQIASLRLRYNNIEGGGYNTFYEFCEVTYKDSK